MNFGVMIDTFFSDDKIGVLLLLIVVDFLFGVIAAFKVGNFRLSYVMDFLRNDIAFKVLPYFILYAGALVAGNQSFLIDGLDMGVLAGAVYAGLLLAFTGSIMSSVMELKLAPDVPQSTSLALAGSENSAPPKD